MHIFDVLEAWLFSMRMSLDSSGVIARFERSPNDRLNPSCNLNLRLGEHEVDLLIWESGEAEFATGTVGGPISQVHFDDIRNRADLGEVLSRLADLIFLGLRCPRDT